VSGFRAVDLGLPALLEFRGPDAVRFLNGQLTQDLRLVAGGKNSLPSCVTDAKGRLQFRVTITEVDDGVLWIEAPAGQEEGLEARLTRYLIADDVETAGLTGKFALWHWLGAAPVPPAGVMVRASNRFNVAGADWWLPAGLSHGLPETAEWLAGDELEAFRIANGVPAWGRELVEGLLPPEAGLDQTDISYHKGCYIGQEVISRIKFAGKLNRRLARFALPETVAPDSLQLVDSAGNPAGNLTSISPELAAGGRAAMGYVKRGVEDVFVMDAGGCLHRVGSI
jgi:folate-binding protein YgfZ